MWKPSRVLLFVALLASACGFNDTQRIAFVRTAALAILKTTAPDSHAAGSTLLSLDSKESERTPALAGPKPAPFPKVHLASKCPKASQKRIHETAEVATKLLLPLVPLGKQASVVRHDARHQSIARLRCRLASAGSKLRRVLLTRSFVVAAEQASSCTVISQNGVGEMSFVFVGDPDPVPLDAQTTATDPTVGG